MFNISFLARLFPPHGILDYIAIIYLMFGYIFAFIGMFRSLRSVVLFKARPNISDENKFAGGFYLTVSITYFIFAVIISLI